MFRSETSPLRVVQLRETTDVWRSSLQSENTDQSAAEFNTVTLTTYSWR